MQAQHLNSFFLPDSIAVIGASDKENSVGGRLLLNLIQGSFAGDLYPVNPKHDELQGLKSYPNIDAIPKIVELVVIATPASTVADILKQCGENKIRAAIILTAGFSEMGTEGKNLQKKIKEIALFYNIRIVGPNCLGIMRPSHNMNATFAHGFVENGHLALVSQSGAICTAIIDWATSQGIGFSAVVSTGESMNTGFGEILDYLAMDPKTSAILLYVEGITNARYFLSGLRSVAKIKPVILIKSGRFDAGMKAAMSHTGALVGNDDVFNAAIERAGVVRVYSISQLFSAARLLANNYTYLNNKLVIITNAGGPGVMAADRASEIGLPISELSDKTLSALSKALPPFWSHANPIDILGDATPERYQHALEICLNDNEIGGVLVILTPQAMTDPTKVAEIVVECAKNNTKPVLVSWTGGTRVQEGRKKFARSKAAHFSTPEDAVDAFSFISSYHTNQQLLRQIPMPLEEFTPPDTQGAKLILNQIISSGRKQLTSQESKALLSAFRIPVTQTIRINSLEEAMITAETIGLPIALKIDMPEFSHKTDVGGVKLNIASLQDLTIAYRQMKEQMKAKFPEIDPRFTIEPMHVSKNGREMMIGVIRDSVFGVVISFGLGGTMVEVIKDNAVTLPPLNSFIIEQLINKTKAAKLLKEFRNMPEVNRQSLINVLLCLSNLVSELPEIMELDINPLIVDEKGSVAVDARIAVASCQHIEKYAHMAIHPYPSHLSEQISLADGTEILIRPVRPEDAEMEKNFVHNLSNESKYFRFMQMLHELTPEMLIRFTQIDYDREMAFIAVVNSREVGIARYIINPDYQSADFALVIADDFHEMGLGQKLMEKIIKTAKIKGISIIQGEVLAINKPMLSLMRKLGFSIKALTGDNSIMSVTRQLNE